MIKPTKSPVRRKQPWGPDDTQHLLVGAGAVVLVGCAVLGFMKFVL